MHNVQVTPIIGLPQLDGWSHVTQNQSSTLIWNVSLHGNHARNVGRDLLDLISNSEPTNSADFYRVFQQVIAESQDKESKLSCAAVFFEKDVLTFVTYDAQILLRRDSKVGTLLNGLETTKIIQGKAQPDDVIILATARATIFLDEVRLKIKQGYDVDTVVTSLTPSLQLEDNSSLAALAFIQIKPPKRVEIEPEVEAKTEVEIVPGIVSKIQPKIVAETQPVAVPKTERETKSELEQHFEPSVFEPAVFESAVFEPAVMDPDRQTSFTPDFKRSQDSDALLETASNSPAVAELPLKPNERSTVIDISKATDKVFAFFKKAFSIILANSKKIAAVGSKQIIEQAGSFKENAPRYIAKSKSLAQSLQAILQKVSRRVFNQDVYVNRTQSKKYARLAVVGIAVILVVASIFGWWRWQRLSQLESVRTDLAPLQQEFEQLATATADSLLLTRDKIVRIQDQIVALQQIYKDSPLGMEILNSFAVQVQTAYEEVAGREELQDLSVFFNLSSIEKSFIGSDFSLQDNQLWVLDGEAQNVVQLSLDSKEGQIFSFNPTVDQERESEDTQDLSQRRLRSLAVNPGANTVYALGKEIIQLNIQTGDTRVLVKSRSELEGARMIRAYGPNIYIFNPQRQNIFRFTIDDDATTSPRGWVRSSQGLQYDRVLSMTIDGDIWLGSRTGSLLRMRTGRPEAFTISGLERPFESDLVVYTQEGFDHVYVLESNANRVVQLTKDGVFVREVVSPTLAAVTSIVVTADESSILALSGSLIYELEL
jgi:hypothetical protein